MVTNTPSIQVEDRPESSAGERPGPPVHRLLEQRARAHPERVALLFKDEKWTYDELNRRANQLAHHLQQLGIEPDDPVGVHVDRSPHLVSSLLGVMKAGGAYVALDPTLPPERLQFMSEDAGIDTIVATEASIFQNWETETIVDVTSPQVDQEPEDNPEVKLTDEHLAYILYTSGTTGTPKGVMQTHRALRHHVHVFNEEVGQRTGDCRFLFKSSYSFDLSISELFPPLAQGACVAIAEPKAPGVSRLTQTLLRHGVTDLFVTPTRLRLLIDRSDFRDCDTVERVYSAGEALSGDVLFSSSTTRFPLRSLGKLTIRPLSLLRTLYLRTQNAQSCENPPLQLELPTGGMGREESSSGGRRSRTRMSGTLPPCGDPLSPSPPRHPH